MIYVPSFHATAKKSIQRKWYKSNLTFYYQFREIFIIIFRLKVTTLCDCDNEQMYGWVERHRNEIK